MSHTEPNLPPDLLEVAETLETRGPRMTEPELARVRRTVLQRTTARTRRPAAFTRSRLAIVSMLSLGALMSSGGAALGVSALSTDLSARAAQYGTSGQAGSGTINPPPVLAPPTATGSGDEGTDTAAPPSTEALVSPAATQTPRQLAAGEADELPFTGYLAIPLLLLGLALFVAGFALRRGVRSSAAAS